MLKSVQFPYLPLSQFAGGKTNIRRPREIAYFSYDSDRKLLPLSDSSLKYYCPPMFGAPGETDDNFPIHLGDGFETFKQHDDSVDEHLDALLDTLQTLEQQTQQRVQADFVTWRGMITKGTIYIEENHDFKKQGDNRWPSGQVPVHMRRAQYMGYKFETLSTLRQRRVNATREEIESRPALQVSNEEQYCSIVQTGIGDMSLILGGEVDAVLGEKPDDPEEPIPWIELKTTRNIVSAKDESVYADKWLKFWAQSFLLGVPYIVIGFRTVEGRLLSMEQIHTHRFPTMAKQRAAKFNMQTWDGNLCVNFAARLLNFFKQHITEAGVVWRIRHAPRSGYVALDVDRTIESASIVKSSFQQHRAALTL